MSPLKPLIFLGIAAVALSLCHLRWSSLLEDCYILRSGFLGFKGPSFAGIRQHEREISRLLSAGPLDLRGAYYLLALVVVQGLYYLDKTQCFRSALDGPGFGRFYIFSSLVVYTGLFFLLLRFVVVWSELHKLLRRFYFHPTRGCYRSLRVKRLGEPDDQRIRLFEPVHNMTGVEFCLERARELLKLAQDSLGSKLAVSVRNANLQKRIDACEEHLSELHRAAADWRKAAPADFAVQRTMATLSAVMTELFDSVWRLGPASTPPAAVVGTSTEHKLVDQAELFIACRVLDFLRRVYPQMMNLVGFAVAGILAMMLSSSAYPMPAPDTGLWLAWSASLTAVGVSLYVFVRMNMSRVISLLQGTTPGYFNLTGSFAIQLLFFGVVPILTTLGAQFPHGLGSIFSWAGGIFGSAR